MSLNLHTLEIKPKNIFLNICIRKYESLKPKKNLELINQLACFIIKDTDLITEK